jgi:hypothetical protein
MKQAYNFGLHRKEIHLGSNEYLYGFINKKGKWIINPQYQFAGRTFDKYGYCVAKKEGLYGFINLQGEWLISPSFDALGFGFGRHQCCPASISKKWGVIDRNGDWIVQPIFESLGIEFDKKGFCPAAQDNKWGFINKKGNWIIEPHFDSMYCEPTGTRISSFGDNNTCIVQIEKQSYRINRKGNIESLLKPVAVLDYSALFNLSGFNTIVTY